jgi:tRNA dimethylallyltransferase
MAIRLNLLIGCTGSGKSRVGCELARRMGGEIVSVDSMKIYRRMDIGTAKPSAEAQAAVPHHLVDVVEPSESFSLGRYVESAGAAIRDIAARGKPVLAVGGTMMFVRGLVSGVFEGPPADLEFRRRVREQAAREGTAVLHAELARVDPRAASRIHPNDLRRIERALEVHHKLGTPISELQKQWEQSHGPYDCRLVALQWPREQASRRINARVDRMMEAGLVREVQSLLAEPDGIGEQAAQAVGYAEIIAHLRGELSLEQAVEQIKINSRHLAKHQRTWMRHFTDLRYVEVDAAGTVDWVASQVHSAWDQSAGPTG